MENLKYSTQVKPGGSQKVKFRSPRKQRVVVKNLITGSQLLSIIYALNFRDVFKMHIDISKISSFLAPWWEKVMAIHPSTLAWKIPWAEEPSRLQSMGPQSWTRLSDFTFTFHFHASEKEMATHSSALVWRIPGTAEPDGLPSMGLQSQTQLKWLSSSSSSSSLMAKEMPTHSSILAWRIPCPEEPGRLQSMGSQESDMT